METDQDENDSGRPYAGALAEKIPPPKSDPSSLLGGRKPSFDHLHVPTAWVNKLGLLLDHFQIDRADPERWFTLAFNLAIAYVPGFAIDQSDPVGAKPIWDRETLTRLYVEVTDLVAARRTTDPKFSNSSACEILAKREPWRSLKSEPTGGTLRRRYAEATNEFLIKFAEGLRMEPRTALMADEMLRAMAGMKSVDEALKVIDVLRKNNSQDEKP